MQTNLKVPRKLTLDLPRRLTLEKKDILPTAFCVLAALTLLNTLAMFSLASSFAAFKENSKRTLIQKQDGETFLAEVADAEYRTPEAVKIFVKEWVKSQFHYAGIVTTLEGDQKRDEGIPIGDHLLPTTAVNAVYALESTLRLEFINNLAQKWVPTQYFGGQEPEVTNVEVKEVGTPIMNEEGRYEVVLAAAIQYFEPGEALGKTKLYTVTLTVAPIEIPDEPGPDATLQEKIAYHWQKQGMQIVKITPILE